MHAVLGAGPIGRATADLLLDRGEEVVVATRGGVDLTPGIRHVTVDATDPAALAAALAGATVVYNCASPAYHRWATEWPPLAAAILSAAEQLGAVLVTAGNLYGYGPVAGPRTPELPAAATDAKGQVRAQMWTSALAAHRDGRVRVTEARGSDYYGPGVGNTGYLGARTLQRLTTGKPVQMFGDPDMPHSWTYVPDFAATMVALGSDDRAWGRAWHVPTAPALSFRAAVDGLAAALDVPAVPVRRMSWPMVRALGLVVPPLRGLADLRYQFDEPFEIDAVETTATFGLTPTPNTVGFAATAAEFTTSATPSVR